MLLSGCYLRLNIDDKTTLSETSPKPIQNLLKISSSGAVDEGAPVIFTISLDQPQEKDVSFDYEVVNSQGISGVDSPPLQGRLTIAAGSTSVTLSVSTLPRHGYQGDRNLVLKITNVEGSGVGPTEANTEIKETALNPGLIVNLNKNSLSFEKIQIGTKLFFSAFTPAEGWELWVSDGTPTGTILVKDIFPGTSSSHIRSLYAFNNKVYFSANDGVHGDEIWTSDGTTAGTHLVFDSNPGIGDSEFNPRIVYQNKMIFTVQTYSQTSPTDLGRQDQIWAIDDQDQVHAIYRPTVNPTNFTTPAYNINSDLEFATLGSNLYFMGFVPCTLPCNQRTLFRSNGTEAGTVKVYGPAREAALVFQPRLSSCGGKLFFFESTGIKLMASDGTDDPNPAGTVLIDSNYSLLFECFQNKQLYYSTSMSYQPIKSSDGTVGGTQQLTASTVYKGVNTWFLAKGPSSLFFTLYDLTSGEEIWFTDGTSGNTRRVADLANGILSPLFSIQPGQTQKQDVMLLNDKLLFVTTTSTEGSELWISDGTSSGTVLLKDIYGGPGSSFPYGFTRINNKMVFAARSETGSQDLWQTDGTSNGTTLLKVINPNGRGGIENLVALDSDTLLFTAYNQQHDESELASFKLSTGQLSFLTGPQFADEGMGYKFLFQLGQEIFFAGDDGSWGTKIYQTDLTKLGTGPVASIAPNGGCSDVKPVGVLGSEGFFLASTPETGLELWKTDGTSLGTMLVKDGTPGSEGFKYLFPYTNFSQTMTVNGHLIYLGMESIHGAELWSTDGTASGTQMLGDISPGWQNGFFGFPFYKSISSTPTLAYFAASDPTHGMELWKTDGTVAGTSLMVDLIPGTGSSVDSTALTGIEHVEFNGDIIANIYGGPTIGKEPYLIRNGTLSLLKDINSGSSSSDVFNLTRAGSMIYFSATTAAEGRELWKTDGTPAGTTLAGEIEPGATSSNPGNFTATTTHLYFTADTSATGVENWSYDLSNGQLTLLNDLCPGVCDSVGGGFSLPTLSLNGRYFFTAFSQGTASNFELFVSDGSAAGTTLLSSFLGLPQEAIITNIFQFKNEAYIFVEVPSVGPWASLWKTDGTPAGTSLIKNFPSHNSPFYYLPEVIVGTDVFYFMLNTGESGWELWRSDGTTTGTLLPQESVSGPDGFLGSISGYSRLLDGDILFYQNKTEKYGLESYVAYPQ